MKNLDIFQMEKDKLIGTLKCPYCKELLDIHQVLKNCSISWPQQDWVYFECPYCQINSHVTITSELVSTGVLDGAPGPVFFACSEKAFDDMFVYKTNEYIKCIYEDKEYLFKAK